jgi:hypothetical protein
MVMTLTKSDTLAFQVGGWGMRLTTSFLYIILLEKPTMIVSDGSEGINRKRPGMYKETRIRTWNVLTLFKRGALKNLEKVLQEYKLDITTLQEIRWVGEGILKRQG